VQNVSQWPNLRHLAEPLGGAVGLCPCVCSKWLEVLRGKDVCDPVYVVLTFYNHRTIGHHLSVCLKINVSICITHLVYNAYISHFPSLTRASSRTATTCSLQTPANAAAGKAAPVSYTKVTTFRNPRKWVTTHFTVSRRVEGWVDQLDECLRLW